MYLQGGVEVIPDKKIGNRSCTESGKRDLLKITTLIFHQAPPLSSKLHLWVCIELMSQNFN